METWGEGSRTNKWVRCPNMGIMYQLFHKRWEGDGWVSPSFFNFDIFSKCVSWCQPPFQVGEVPPSFKFAMVLNTLQCSIWQTWTIFVSSTLGHIYEQYIGPDFSYAVKWFNVVCKLYYSVIFWRFGRQFLQWLICVSFHFSMLQRKYIPDWLVVITLQ